MYKALAFVTLIFVVIPACTTDPNTQKPVPAGCGSNGAPAQAGSVSSAMTLAPGVHDVTVRALDLDSNRELTNSETYPVLDHGFKLDLPYGHYDIEVTDSANRVVARYPGVDVNGDVTLGAPSPQ